MWIHTRASYIIYKIAPTTEVDEILFEIYLPKMCVGIPSEYNNFNELREGERYEKHLYQLHHNFYQHLDLIQINLKIEQFYQNRNINIQKCNIIYLH